MKSGTIYEGLSARGLIERREAICKDLAYLASAMELGSAWTQAGPAVPQAARRSSVCAVRACRHQGNVPS
jgi:hypothetical protein